MHVGWNEFDRIFGTMGLLRNRLDSVFGEFDRGFTYAPSRCAVDRIPRTNLYDTGDSLEVVAAIPGIAGEDLKVNIQGNYLEISGSRKSETPEGYKAHRTERGATSFTRSFTLPYEIEADQVKATLKDGLLTMTLPKADAAKPRQITVH